MKLIIVESPAKAKTIKNFLGKEYMVIASKGHIRDLPKHGLGIEIKDKNFIPNYEISSDHKEIAQDIKKLSKSASTIYIATDEDREGEAIGFHIAQIISPKLSDFPRIVFHEITKTAITESLKNPRTIDMNMVNAQQARRLLDRIVGFKLSPLLNQKIRKGLSAGRVQSSALKLVIDKEREIQKFVPVKYFTIDAIFASDKKKIEAQLFEWRGKKLAKLDLKDKAETESMLKEILDSKFKVINIETKQKNSAPPPPFMTSTLQQSASSALGYSPSRTMQIAQRLYEGVETDEGVMGLITYMRTDSLNIAKVAQDSARKIIAEKYGKEFIPPKPRIYATKQKNAQEAHEAIRPTRLDFSPQIAQKYLKPDELKLYTLIYNRFLASQSSNAIFENQNVFFGANSAVFKASGSKLVFEGFYKILGSEDKDKLLPNLKLNSDIELESCAINAHQTEPPARFSEASLIKTLEGLGIGRPSTYAPTISLLLKREYIEIEKKQIVPTEISFVVIEMLEKHFLEIVDSNFTAKLEEKLDSIAESKADWQEILWEFYEPFLEKINEGKLNITSLKTTQKTGESCPQCGKELVIRSGKYGEFTACSGYPKCKYVKRDEKEETTDYGVCENCGKPMVKKIAKYGEFLACSGYPKCKKTISLGNKSDNRVYLDVSCPKCGGKLVERKSKRGKFYGCTNYPKCNFISNYKLSPEKCELCGAYSVIKELKKGTFIECSSCKNKKEA